MKNEEKQVVTTEKINDTLSSLLLLYKTNEYIDSKSEQYTQASKIFDIIPELDSIQKNARNKLIKFLRYKSFQMGDKVIYENEKSPDLYIVLKGVLFLQNPNTKKDIKRIIVKWRRYQDKNRNTDNSPGSPENENNELSDKVFPGQAVGDCFRYTGKKYKQRDIFAIENTEVLVCSNNQIFKVIDELNSNENFKEIVEFLVKKVHLFSKLSLMYRDRIATCFKIKNFIKGMPLILEKQISNFVYLIKEGECKIVSSRSTLEFYDRLKGDFITKDIEVRGKLGYMSNSLNSFQIGIIGPGHWVGDEFLLLKNGKYDYSVISNSGVEALEISKQDFLTKFPKDFYDYFKANIQERYNWIMKRFTEISASSNKVSNMNKNIDKIDENFIEYKKKYPKLNQNAFIKIRKKKLITEMSSKMISKNIDSASNNFKFIQSNKKFASKDIIVTKKQYYPLVTTFYNGENFRSNNNINFNNSNISLTKANNLSIFEKTRNFMKSQSNFNLSNQKRIITSGYSYRSTSKGLVPTFNSLNLEKRSEYGKNIGFAIGGNKKVLSEIIKKKQFDTAKNLPLNHFEGSQYLNFKQNLEIQTSSLNPFTFIHYSKN